jgi:hypothetical protein
MKLPSDAIQQFQTAWLASFGEEISWEEAEIEAQKLLALHGRLLERINSQRIKMNMNYAKPTLRT